MNVDPSGEAVIAGRAAPNEKVELRDGGKTVAEATADASGQFVIIPPALAPGDHSLSLAASVDKGQPAISSPVAVSVPAQSQGRLRQGRRGDARRRRPQSQRTRRHRLLSECGPWRRQRLSPAPASRSSRSRLTPPAALSPKGRQSRTHRAPLSQSGRPRRGQDAIGWPLVVDDPTRHEPRRVCPARRRDQPWRCERRRERRYAPFDYPDMPAAPASPAAPIAARQAPSHRQRPRPPTRWSSSIQTKRVVTGHTLWALSKSYYGDPTRYPAIVEANRAQIHNPNVIFPGQVFVVPKSDAKP